MKKILLTAGIILATASVVLAFSNPQAWFFSSTEQSEPPATTTTSGSEEIEIVAENLSVPWGIDFLPSGNLLITERTGGLLELTPDGERMITNTIDSSEPEGEGGLLGVALHPEFSENNWLYVYETTELSGGLENRVLRYRYENGDLNNQTIVVDGIDGAAYHDGGRIDFSPDGYLFITTGDASQPESAQSTSSYQGKILRVMDDGSVPEDNPFGNAVYSYGHRNPQGLSWDGSGRLLSTEHGRSGASSGLDEVNLIQVGGNYGWPYLEGNETCEQTDLYSPVWPTDSSCNATPPLRHSGPDITWAPASAAVADESLFFGGLRGQALYEAPIEDSGMELRLGEVQTHFKNRFGRLRSITVDPSEEFLYMTTSNTDGRGNPTPEDDRLIRVPLSRF